MTTLIDLIRHGEPEGGALYRGHIDHPLSELGWRQMHNAVAGDKPWQQIVSSTLSRCSAFAEQLSGRHHIPLQYESRFMEIGFGEWEGKSAEQLEAERKEEFYAFYDDPVNNTPTGAEPLMDFRQRVLTAWDEMLKQYQDQHVLVVGHAGMMRVILAEILQMPINAMYRIQIPNAALSRISITGSGATAYPQLHFHAGQL